MSQKIQEPGFKSAIELSAMITSKAISSVALTEYFIARIEKFDQQLNAMVVRDFDNALQAAKQADKHLAKGRVLGPLHGLPISVKESFDVQGLKTTWGMPAWKDRVAKTDAHVVSALKGAGAHILGKTNVPEMLADFQSYNAVYGQTNNPWDISKTPGGSSGGSAAVLSAGLTGLEAGSDIGGSIRNPAHYCGVYGHKPTWGIVPFAGHKPPVVDVSNGPDIAVVGPLGRSAEDLRLSMALTVGPITLNKKGWKIDLPAPRARALKDFRVAFWHTDDAAPVDQMVVEKSELLAAELVRMGTKISTQARPDIDTDIAMNTYSNLMQAVNHSGVSPAVFASNQRAAEKYSPADISNAAVMARGAVQSYNDWALHDHQRTLMRHAWNRFFAEWDVLVCPISVSTAFAHDHGPFAARKLNINGQQSGYFKGLFWAGMSIVGNLPSTVFPMGLAENGMPVGLQVIGAEFDDYTTIEFARLVAEVFGGFRPPAGYGD
ncbi:MAG: amidase [Pseudomonadales bacterium]|nr:amidase [Pseudomonadales bacterium]